MQIPCKILSCFKISSIKLLLAMALQRRAKFTIPMTLTRSIHCFAKVHLLTRSTNEITSGGKFNIFQARTWHKYRPECTEHATSSEKCFFLGRGLSPYAEKHPTSCLPSSRLDPFLRPPKFHPDLRQFWTADTHELSRRVCTAVVVEHPASADRRDDGMGWDSRRRTRVTDDASSVIQYSLVPVDVKLGHSSENGFAIVHA